MAVGSLLDDLVDRGMFERTLVVVMGEFGRSPKVNAAAGRDHWNFCYSLMLAGGGIKPGFVYGASNEARRPAADKPVIPAEIIATIYEAWGYPTRSSFATRSIALTCWSPGASRCRSCLRKGLDPRSDRWLQGSTQVKLCEPRSFPQGQIVNAGNSMPVVALDAFLTNLVRSGLLTKPQLADLKADVEAAAAQLSASDLAARLIERQWLTRWQAGRLLAGQTTHSPSESTNSSVSWAAGGWGPSTRPSSARWDGP